MENSKKQTDGSKKPNDEFVKEKDEFVKDKFTTILRELFLSAQCNKSHYLTHR